MNEKLITLLIAFAVLAAGTMMQSCGDNDEPEPGMIFDVYPIVFTIAVENAAGDDLLADSAFVENLALIYKGKTTPVTAAGSRAYMPHWSGARLVSGSDGRHTIVVGEFDGDGSYSDEFVLRVDSRDYRFSFSTKAKYKKDDIKFTRHYYLDGEAIPPYDNHCIVSHTIVR